MSGQIGGGGMIQNESEANREIVRTSGNETGRSRYKQTRHLNA